MAIEDINEISENEYNFFYTLYSSNGIRYMKCYGSIYFKSISGTLISPLYYGAITNLQLTPNHTGFDIEKIYWLNFASKECTGLFTINQYNGLHVGQSTNAKVAFVNSLSFYITSPPRSASLTWEILCKMKTNS